MQSVRASLLLLLAALWGSPPLAQTTPPHDQTARHAQASPEQQLADYLDLLKQIAPAAEAAARVYLAAFRLRCGRSLDISSLRQAMAQDGGDPVLMGLIRAAAMQDIAARRRLVDQVPCPTRAAP